MKSFTASLAILLFLASLLPGQEVSPPAAPIQAEIASDADGDLIPDGLDANPLIPDTPEFSWWVSDVTVGWDLDQSRIDKLESTTGTEESNQQKRSFTVKGGIGGGGGYGFGINTDPSSLFLSLLPGGAFLKRDGDGFKSQSHLAVSFGFEKSKNRTQAVNEIRSEFEKLEKQRAIKNRHIEFTVEFFNRTDAPYQFTNFTIPIQTAERQTRAEALSYTAGKEILDFEVPGSRVSGYPVRFRANLTTTQSEQILDALENGELRIAIDRANGTAVNQVTRIDEIARRQQLTDSVDRNTAALEFRAPGNSSVWRIARHNPVTNRPTTVADAIRAINAMVASPEDPEYLETGAGILYAVGSIRNTLHNPLEVANAKTAPLKASGWTRSHRYGPDRDGQWEHRLEAPLEGGAVFTYAPYQVTRPELAWQIENRDPALSSEWLSLCHFWLHYDPGKPFREHPVSLTNYPLRPFLQSLSPGFAIADFDGMMRKWFTRKGNGTTPGPDTPQAIEQAAFLEQVRVYRKSILDAAVAGYSEAGALLARIPEQNRDKIESEAVRSAIRSGNLDALAVESISRLFRNLNREGGTAPDAPTLPDHVFARNLFGFLKFAECGDGTDPGPARNAALRAFSYSAGLGNPFAESMKGWLLVTMAEQEKRRWFSGSGWTRYRDEGMALLRKGAPGSALGSWLLGRIYLENDLGIPRDESLSKSYLQAAAKANFNR